MLPSLPTSYTSNLKKPTPWSAWEKMLTLQYLPGALAIRQSFPLFHANRFATVNTETQSGNTFESSSQPILKSFGEETKGAGRHVLAGFRTWKPLPIPKNRNKARNLGNDALQGKSLPKSFQETRFRVWQPTSHTEFVNSTTAADSMRGEERTEGRPHHVCTRRETLILGCWRESRCHNLNQGPECFGTSNSV